MAVSSSQAIEGGVVRQEDLERAQRQFEELVQAAIDLSLRSGTNYVDLLVGSLSIRTTQLTQAKNF